MNLESMQHVADPGAALGGPCSFQRPTQIAGVANLAEVRPAQVDWLWPGRIPIGTLSLLIGDTGVGKTLLTLDVSARVSRGATWPDREKAEGGRGRAEGSCSTDLPPSALPLPPSSVVLLSAEDSLTDTVRPRLEALGADCSRIYSFAVQADSAPDIDDDGSTPRIGLRRDLKRLRSLLDSLPDCRLVVVDPITAYLAGSENSSTEVRRFLRPLAALARECRVAVIAVGHLRKKEGTALYRANGSLALVNSVRTVWLVTHDPVKSERRLLVPVKSNLGATAPDLSFTIESAFPPLPPGEGRSKGALRAAPLTITRPPQRPRQSSNGLSIRCRSPRRTSAPTPTADPITNVPMPRAGCLRRLRRARDHPARSKRKRLPTASGPGPCNARFAIWAERPSASDLAHWGGGSGACLA
jgi:hypothetical protein